MTSVYAHLLCKTVTFLRSKKKKSQLSPPCTRRAKHTASHIACTMQGPWIKNDDNKERDEMTNVGEKYGKKRRRLPPQNVLSKASMKEGL